MENSIEQISLAARNYAEALIQIGQDNIVPFDKLSADLRDINDTIQSSDELKTLLIDPSITEDVKIDIIESIFADSVDARIINFLKILVSKKRIGEFPQIYADFIAKLNIIHNIQPVTVVSAVELSEDYKHRIVDSLNNKLGKSVQPEWQVEKDIIAGLTVKINDDVIDMSLKNRIDSLSKSLMLK